MDAASETPPKVLPSLKRLVQVLLATAANRLELAAVEAREEASRWTEALLLVGAVLAVGFLAVVMVSLTIIVACWDGHRMAALLGLSAFYLLGTGLLAWRLRWRFKHWPSFSVTIAELRKDKTCFESENGSPTNFNSANRG